MTDLELLERARGGDAHAFGQLVDRHRAAAYRAARAALGSPQEADDVVQEACIAAFHKLRDFRGEATFRTWLVAITWRRALSQRRSVARWARSFGRRPFDIGGASRDAEPADAIPERGVAGASTPESLVLGRELVSAITRVVRALPARLRDPLLLVGSGEFSYDEVASLVGAPVGTVKWRVSEARQQVRTRLRRLGFGDVA